MYIPRHITRIESDGEDDTLSTLLPSLTKLTFADNSRLEYIDRYAFQALPFLSINARDGAARLPSYVNSIGDYAFARSFCLDANPGPLVLYSPITLGEYAFHQCDFGKVYFTGIRSASLGSNAFTRCRDLEVVIFDVDATLSANAFLQCAKLKAIVFYNEVTIGDGAFHGCGQHLRLFFNRIDPFELYTDEEWHAKGIMHTERAHAALDDLDEQPDLQLVEFEAHELPNMFRRMGLDEEQARNTLA